MLLQRISLVFGLRSMLMSHWLLPQAQFSILNPAGTRSWTSET